MRVGGGGGGGGDSIDRCITPGWKVSIYTHTLIAHWFRRGGGQEETTGTSWLEQNYSKGSLYGIAHANHL